MFFLSHGDDHGIMMTDVRFAREEIFEKFRTKKTTLGGKPKIFVFQACHGRQRPSQIHVERSDAVVDAQSFCQEQQISEILEKGVKMTLPSGSDFLVCNAANKGFVSYRNEVTGSHYIQALVKVLDSYFEGKIGNGDDDFFRVLTWVSREVAQNNYSEHKQMPAFNSTLTKLFYVPRNKNLQISTSIIEPKTGTTDISETYEKQTFTKGQMTEITSHKTVYRHIHK